MTHHKLQNGKFCGWSRESMREWLQCRIVMNTDIDSKMFPHELPEFTTLAKDIFQQFDDICRTCLAAIAKWLHVPAQYASCCNMIG